MLCMLMTHLCAIKHLHRAMAQGSHSPTGGVTHTTDIGNASGYDPLIMIHGALITS